MPGGTDGGERRERAQRGPASFAVAVTCKEWPQVERLIALNATRSGIYLKSDQKAVIGTTLRLEIELPNGIQLQLGGTVVHVMSPEKAAAHGIAPGFGVKLDKAHESDLVLLDAMARAES